MPAQAGPDAVAGDHVAVRERRRVIAVVTGLLLEQASIVRGPDSSYVVEPTCDTRDAIDETHLSPKKAVFFSLFVSCLVLV